MKISEAIGGARGIEISSEIFEIVIESFSYVLLTKEMTFLEYRP